MDLIAWKNETLRALRAELADDPFWRGKLAAPSLRVHLAVFVEPWLSWLLDGTKTIESRFSLRRGVPYGKVETGDVLLLKRSSGPVVGICEVACARYFDFEEVARAEVQEQFGEAIGADDAFWESVDGARYATLLDVREPRAIASVVCPKRDRRGWVTFA